MTENNKWKDKKVYVTGGNGFLGSWLTKKLVELGAEVTLLIRDEVHNCGLNVLDVKNFNIVNGDLNDFALVERSVNEFECEAIFHLAAQAIVGTANRSPLPTFHTNIMGTCNILEAARQIDTVKRVVVASSDKAYGPCDNLPYLESEPLKGKHPYDVSKSCTDLISQSYFSTYGLPVSIARCANLYGGADFNYSRIVPGTIRSILMNQNPIIRSDGTFKRDYLYVEDACEAYLKLCESTKSNGEAFNFGLNTPYSVIDLVNKMIKISGKEGITPDIRNTAKAEIKDQYLDSTKAREKLSWKPAHDIGEGLSKSYIWYKKYLEDNNLI